MVAITTDTRIYELPIEARRAIRPDFLRYLADRSLWQSPGDTGSADIVLNLTDTPSEYWGSAEHQFLRDFRLAVVNGTFTLTAETPTEGKDRADLGTALAVMRRREADAIRDMINLRQEVIRLREAQPQAVIPWGPEHPDWLPFWAQGAMDATAAGNCSEYDRHAREMGAPDRYDASIQDLMNDGEFEHRVRLYWEATVTVRGSTIVTTTTSSRDFDIDDIDVSEYLADIDVQSEGDEFNVEDHDVHDHYVLSTERITSTDRVWTNPAGA